MYSYDLKKNLILMFTKSELTWDIINIWILDNSEVLIVILDIFIKPEIEWRT